MWTAVVEVEMPRNFGMSFAERLAGRVRRAGVLIVWAGLAVLRPRLALEILRERRSGALRGAPRWPSGLTAASERAVRTLRSGQVR